MARSQYIGPIGWGVDRMIRHSVKKSFHSVWWSAPASVVPEPCIFVANHHGWFDGYLMYHAVTKLQCASLDWIAEFDAFPLFKYCGGMPFPADRPMRRSITIRHTIKRMREEKMNLILFAEGILHRPPEILTFGKSLQVLCEKVPGAYVAPVAIRYEIAMHERPQAYLVFGEPQPAQNLSSESVRLKVKSLLDLGAQRISFEPESFDLLARGTQDVNERFDMRNAPWNRKRQK
jgi:1-acyl-sn-glycerol-3-phosphate acyltransferase